MSDIQQRLQNFDGELDAAEVAEDPALASLADRLYGIKIQPVQPKKLEDFLMNNPLQLSHLFLQRI